MTTFGPYELQGLAGRGGMGEVHRAYDRDHARLVALKVLPETLAADARFVERFKRESYAAAQLNEPHVIPIHRYGEIGGRLYIDMRLVDGVDLAQLIAAEGRLPPERAVLIVGQAAQALDAAHARQLLHRDVKPSNLLVTPSDFVYLVDFGIAQVSGSGGPTLTADGSMIGTYEYMAPERVEGRADVDGRADLYSLACVLYEALTGQRPFPADNALALMNAHLHTPPPLVTGLRPDAPAGLDAVIARGMAKDPSARYPTCGALAADAARALRGEAPRPAPVPVDSPAPPTSAPLTSAPAAAGSAAAGSAYSPPTYVPPSPQAAWPPAAAWPPDAAQPSARHSRGLGGWLVAAVALVVIAVLAGVLLGQGAFGGRSSGDGAPTAAGTASDVPEGGTPSSAEPPASTGISAPETTTPVTNARPARARGDLGLPTPISTPACDSSWVVFLGSAVDPGSYAQEIAALLKTYPSASYLLTEGGCSSLRQQLNGNLIYAAYSGPYPSQAAACRARAGVGGDSYVKVLDNTTPAEQLWTC